MSAPSIAVRAGARRAFRQLRPIEASSRRLVQYPQVRCLSSTRSLGQYITPNPNPPLGKKNASNDSPSRIGLIGARGYTGQALIDLFNEHPFMDLRHVSSRELAGQELEGYTKRKLTYESLIPEDIAQLDKDIDCWVMALPNSACKPYIEAIDQAQKNSDHKSVVVDISADYRFDDSWTYGLPEITKRSKIAQSTRISVPGCYATAAQLSIAPIVENDLLGGQPVVFAVSGYSGAGTKPSPRNNVENLTDNLLPYSLTGHIHEREINHHLGISAAFIPHVASWFRGIHHTVNIPLNKQISSRDIRELFQQRYDGEKLVKVVGEAPLVKAIQGRHGVEIGGFAVDKTGKRVVICSTIDNLNKGASTQCLQNMNLALGYAEFEGIPTM
ncbi:Protein arg-6, mitochondrial [Fusarium falciforme]|uniref:Protein arg-6, mitochondrial n=1 Tax=Fusarium falciforme TaxID=195108 RepID=A0A9W8R518_9HYPO|nr:Semialdhyde-dh domain-containing protein [Fusarium falciforme]KAJ4167728.1 Protein arg-6, mitochondrial [Fusarium falciforme]KAJ4188041.1 Protein arg-6, mitochondrial [Fusarium falciforme]KAJ4198624.1 Protein arg-6, mitochondrial [Fusarium falciforme]KAJ4251707.1 Protein arg-6, mitochondrial [Fusarium falciforme]WAO93737.1 Semialdhyde-dh domain-containing protein [Fusarium falciforme]